MENFRAFEDLCLTKLSQGPVQAYMKKVDDALTDVGYGDGWFKVSEAGLNVASKIVELQISLGFF